jgi:hypothetical protein
MGYNSVQTVGSQPAIFMGILPASAGLKEAKEESTKQRLQMEMIPVYVSRMSADFQ